MATNIAIAIIYSIILISAVYFLSQIFKDIKKRKKREKRKVLWHKQIKARKELIYTFERIGIVNDALTFALQIEINEIEVQIKELEQERKELEKITFR